MDNNYGVAGEKDEVASEVSDIDVEEATEEEEEIVVEDASKSQMDFESIRSQILRATSETSGLKKLICGRWQTTVERQPNIIARLWRISSRLRRI